MSIQKSIGIKEIIMTGIAVFFVFSSFGQETKNSAGNYFIDGWKARHYEEPIDYKEKVNTTASQNVTLNIDASEIIAKVLPTHFGVNSNFRGGDGMLTDGIRIPMYQKAHLGAYRFPAGSGSNIYFWDGIIPSDFLIDFNPIDGTQSTALKPENFVRFIDTLGSQATVIVNYFYARYGVTPEGTREARVLQAAKYAAAFVHKMNIELGAGIQNWEVGNECYGGWETGYDVNGSIVTGKEYGEDFRVFADEMKKVDPTIKVGAVMYTKDTDWNPQVMVEVQNHADFFIIHEYFNSEDNSTVENILGSIGQISENVDLLKNTLEQNTNRSLEDFPVALTEFNSRGPHTTTMVNGMFFTQILGEVIKNNLGMSTMWVSEWKWNADQEPKSILAVLDPDQDDYTARPTYMPYHFYGKTFGDHMIEANTVGEGVNAYASLFSSGEIGIAFVNTNSSARGVQINVDNLIGHEIKKAIWYEVYSNTINPGDKKFFINGETGITVGGGPENFDQVAPYKKEFNNSDILVLPAYSMSFIVLTVDTASNIPEIIGYEDLDIYPNPANNKLNLISSEAIINYSIFDLYGKEVLTGSGDYSEIDIADLQAGWHIIKIQTQQEERILNFIKI